MAANKTIEELTPAELTGRTIDAVAVGEAKERRDRIRAGFNAWTELEKDILAAWVARDWAVLGHQSWGDYMADEFGDCLPQFRSGVERAAIIMDLSDAGMSQRAIAAATGASKTTVQRALEDRPLEAEAEDGDAASADDAEAPPESPTEAAGGPSGPPDPGDGPADPDAAATTRRAKPASTTTGTDGRKYNRPAPTAGQPAATAKPRRNSLDRAAEDLFAAIDGVNRLYLGGIRSVDKDPVPAERGDVTRFSTDQHRESIRRLMTFLKDAGLLSDDAGPLPAGWQHAPPATRRGMPGPQGRYCLCRYCPHGIGAPAIARLAIDACY